SLGIANIEPKLWIDYAGHIKRESKREVILLNFPHPGEPDTAEYFNGISPMPYNLKTVENNRETALQECLVKHESGFSILTVIAEENSEVEEKRLAGLLSFLTFRYEYILV